MDFPTTTCDREADNKKVACASAGLEDLYQNPGFNWQELIIGRQRGGTALARPSCRRRGGGLCTLSSTACGICSSTPPRIRNKVGTRLGQHRNNVWNKTQICQRVDTERRWKKNKQITDTYARMTEIHADRSTGLPRQGQNYIVQGLHS